MSITAEFVYTEEEAVRASVEVSKSAMSSILVRLLIPLLAPREARRRFRGNPNANQKIVWRFDEEKVEDSMEGASSVRVWSKFIEVKEVRDGFLLFPQPRLAHWLPKHAFASEADVSGFRDLVRANGIKFNG
jgi:hypothetical protein